MEELCSIVSSRGILKSCSLRPLVPISSSLKVSFTAGCLLPGGSVYVCTDALEDFFINYFQKFDIAFVLVTGDSDREVSQTLIESALVSQAIKSTKLIAWFAQNLTASHPKLYHLPIGVDYHTASCDKNPFEPGPVTPNEQERLLTELARTAPTFDQRSSLIYADFKPESNRPDRASALTASACFAVAPVQRVTRTNSWNLCRHFQFVLSPAGVGLDCHRTWEALTLGCIPIIKSSPLDPLYEQLPVIFVSSWDDQAIRLAIGSSKVPVNKASMKSLDRLLLEYWVSQIREAGRGHLHGK